MNPLKIKSRFSLFQTCVILLIEFSFLFFLFERIYADTVPPDSLLNELRWTKTEVSDISDLVNGKIFFYENAQKQNFIKFAAQSKVIHLATHAFIDNENPMLSKFMFSYDENSHQNQTLTTYELYNMKLNADLAVLSACNTGTGKLIAGEGIMSLARGFMYAGCPNITMSLWTVDDKSTSILMKDFYKFLKERQGKSSALHQAKLDYIKNADPLKSAPYYWAGFVLVGDDQPVSFQTYSFKKLILIITLLFVLSFLAIISIRNKRRHSQINL